ncbi:hypothetical protein ACIBL3_06290 [Kribbella sp. NPDC050124]|uniref:hypothetical protein n=1 Tax=Kribbella sp. NPDC050124 TaxID=3364114 RepID=UPI0037883FC8
MNDVRPGGPVPYREVSEPGYAEKAAETFVIENFDVGMSLLGGVCPRCQAAIEVPLVDGIFRSAPTTERAERNGHHAVPVICTCTEAHPGRPDGRVGCGAYWIFNLPAGS